MSESLCLSESMNILNRDDSIDGQRNRIRRGVSAWAGLRLKERETAATCSERLQHQLVTVEGAVGEKELAVAKPSDLQPEFEGSAWSSYFRGWG